jgi:hypothetical protein
MRLISGWLLVILGLLQFALTDDSNGQPYGPATVSGSDRATRVRIQNNFGKLPLYFIENRGQMDPRVDYYVQGRDKTLYLTSRGLTFVMSDKDEVRSSDGTLIRKVSYSSATGKSGPGSSLRRWVLKLDFVGANPEVKPLGLDRTSAVISYFKGSHEKWKTDLKTYAGVIYRDLWPGIDLVYTGTVNRLKYTFLVRPGADPGRIRMAYRGTSSVTVSDTGQLEVKTPVGGFRDDRPYTYQDVNGRRVEVATAYTLEPDPQGAKVYGFKVGFYDRSRSLVLDPAILIYCGYLGGSDWDGGYGIAVDAAGNAYVTGYTYSTESTFPVSVGPDLTYNGGDYDAFVAKVNPSGTSLLYCGYLAGSSNDYGYGIAADAAGNAYVTGDTNSTEAQGFPVTRGPDLTYNGGDYDAFVAKVNPSGTSLLYCGYLGGNDRDLSHGIAVDAAGNAYVAGYTSSTEAQGFPVTGGPGLTFNGASDAFVAKISTGLPGNELAADFGGSGLWHYDGGGAWTRISTGNSEDLETFCDDLVADFGTNGLYIYDITWARISTGNAEDMIAKCPYLYVDFNASGLWKYYDATWARISSADAEDLENYKLNLVADFGSYGLYEYDPGIAAWSRISTGDAENMIECGGCLYVDFGSSEFWKYCDGTWERIGIRGTGALEDLGCYDGILFFDAGANGLYVYDGTWMRISTGNAQDMIECGGCLYVDFGLSGLWKYCEGIGWSRISTGDPDGLGCYENKLVVDFGTYGLYEYNGTWTRISTGNCEDMEDVDIY